MLNRGLPTCVRKHITAAIHCVTRGAHRLQPTAVLAPGMLLEAQPAAPSPLAAPRSKHAAVQPGQTNGNQGVCATGVHAAQQAMI